MTAERTPALRRAVSYTARLAQQPRLLLAAKTSLAAVLAWYLAPLIPFAEDQYSYYAPLGALVTMHPTIARSARVGGEVLIGLALGIGLGLCGIAAMRLGAPGGLVLGLVIGVGVLLGGLRLLGVGGDWAPLAGLFVLLTGSADPEGFSISYLGTVAFGVVIGIAVNLVVVPPLYLRRASERLSALRDTVTGLLDDAADAVAEDGIRADRFEAALRTLAETRATVTAEVDEAEESARGNPAAGATVKSGRRTRSAWRRSIARRSSPASSSTCCSNSTRPTTRHSPPRCVTISLARSGRPATSSRRRSATRTRPRGSGRRAMPWSTTSGRSARLAPGRAPRSRQGRRWSCACDASSTYPGPSCEAAPDGVRHGLTMTGVPSGSSDSFVIASGSTRRHPFEIGPERSSW
ncbi:hypothetical protein ACLBXX_03265 [Microbacterium sp. C23T]